MSITVVYKANATITETLEGNPDSASSTKRVVTHDAFDESLTLNAASSPPCTKCALFVLTLTAGAATIDLRALVGTNSGVIDGNGLKLQILRIKNLGANIMTFIEGAANGYALGGTIVVQPGGHVQLFYNDSSPDIAAADKTIDVAGTAAQTAEITVVVG